MVCHSIYQHHTSPQTDKSIYSSWNWLSVFAHTWAYTPIYKLWGHIQNEHQIYIYWLISKSCTYRLQAVVDNVHMAVPWTGHCYLHNTTGRVVFWYVICNTLYLFIYLLFQRGDIFKTQLVQLWHMLLPWICTKYIGLFYVISCYVISEWRSHSWHNFLEQNSSKCEPTKHPSNQHQIYSM